MANQISCERNDNEGQIVELCHECHKPIKIPKKIHDQIEQEEKSSIPRQYVGCERLFLYCGGRYYHDSTCYRG